MILQEIEYINDLPLPPRLTSTCYCLVLALRGAGRLPPLHRGCGIMPRSLLTSAKDILGQGRDYTQLVKQVKDILPQFSDFFRQLVNCVFNGMYFIQFVLV